MLFENKIHQTFPAEKLVLRRVAVSSFPVAHRMHCHAILAQHKMKGWRVGLQQAGVSAVGGFELVETATVAPRAVWPSVAHAQPDENLAEVTADEWMCMQRYVSEHLSE